MKSTMHSFIYTDEQLSTLCGPPNIILVNHKLFLYMDVSLTDSQLYLSVVCNLKRGAGLTQQTPSGVLDGEMKG